MKKIYKYPTGAEVPEEAKYLNTVTQTQIDSTGELDWQRCWLVWHYYEVEVENENKD